MSIVQLIRTASNRLKLLRHLKRFAKVEELDPGRLEYRTFRVHIEPLKTNFSELPCKGVETREIYLLGKAFRDGGFEPLEYSNRNIKVLEILNKARSEASLDQLDFSAFNPLYDRCAHMDPSTEASFGR